MLFFDACVSFFQWACFPVYGITKVRRSDYIVFDRHQLHYLIRFLKSLRPNLMAASSPPSGGSSRK